MASNWRLIKCQLEGTYSWMSYRMTEEDIAKLEKTTRTVVSTDERTPREKAVERLHLDSDGHIVHPSASIISMLKDVGRNHKQTGSRRSLTWIIPAGVRMSEGWIKILNGDGDPATVDDIEVDRQTGVNKNTRGRVLITRPILYKWGAQFDCRVNLNVLDPKIVLQLLNEGGEQVGIGSFRPSCGGPYGTFQVMSWEEISPTKKSKLAKV